jgi:sulfotransferase
MDKLIFNSSMPRSGSELLQVILHQNPKIYASPTSPLIEYQFACRNIFDLPEVKSQDPNIMENALVSVYKNIAHGYYDAITTRPIVIDKSRGWSMLYEMVESWNEAPKMICMVRDLRSVLASFEKIYRTNRHKNTGPDNFETLENMTVDERVDYWLTKVPIGQSLKRLQDLFQKDIYHNILFIKYEDFCHDPQKQLDKIYDYIGEERFQHRFNTIQKEVVEDDSHFGIFGKHEVKPKIERPDPSDWSEVLPIEVSNLVKENYSWYFDSFGY